MEDLALLSGKVLEFSTEPYLRKLSQQCQRSIDVYCICKIMDEDPMVYSSMKVGTQSTDDCMVAKCNIRILIKRTFYKERYRFTVESLIHDLAPDYGGFILTGRLSLLDGKIDLETFPIINKYNFFRWDDRQIISNSWSK